jgi:hypothetical protein
MLDMSKQYSLAVRGNLAANMPDVQLIFKFQSTTDIMRYTTLPLSDPTSGDKADSVDVIYYCPV